jgi:ubiquinone/menaquinone biosynthesis C-methylase UbiE
MTNNNDLDRILKLDPQNPCYSHWRNYHRGDVERSKNVLRFISSKLQLQNATVLDIGCGLGGLSIAVSEWATSVTGIETNEEFVKVATKRATEANRDNVTFVHGTGESLPVVTESVDLVLMNDVIEHFSEPKQAISEVSRVLKPGAHVYVLAPNRGSLSVTFCDPHYHLPFVVWFPQHWRDMLVRKLGRGNHFDGNWFPSMRELISAFQKVHVNLQAVGRMSKLGPREMSPGVFSRILWGYPIYFGVKLRRS